MRAVEATIDGMAIGPNRNIVMLVPQMPVSGDRDELGCAGSMQRRLRVFPLFTLSQGIAGIAGE